MQKNENVDKCRICITIEKCRIVGKMKKNETSKNEEKIQEKKAQQGKVYNFSAFK